MICELNNIKINYEVYGVGTNIIILHGYQVDHRLMTGCLERYFENNSNNNFRRIYIDIPGMGHSTGEEYISNADEMLETIIAFIDKVIPNKKFLLIGQSYGGYLARGIVRRLSTRIYGLFLLCPVIIADKKYRDVAAHAILNKDNEFLSSLPKEQAEDFTSSFVKQNREIYNRYEKEIKEGLKLGRKDFLKKYQDKGYSFSFDVDNINYPFNKPTLIVLGRQDSCVGYKDAYSILENYPRASFAIIDCAGHNIQIEQVNLFEALVKQWIERIEI